MGVRTGAIPCHMAGKAPRRQGTGDLSDERQLKLDEVLPPADAERCEAYADSTGERCQHPAMEPFPYCGDHKHLLDDVDLQRMGLKRPDWDV